MHVLFVTQYFPPEVGATQTRILEFARACQQHGHRVTVLTELPNHPHGHIDPAYQGRLVDREVMEGIDVVRVWVWTRPRKTTATRLAFYASFFSMATILGALVRGPVDVVFATSPPLTVGLIGWLLAKRHRARFVMDVRDLWPAVISAVIDVRGNTLIRAAEGLERFLYRRADRITAVTRGFVHYISKQVARPELVALLPNGAATDEFNPARTTPGLREQMGIGERFVVTFAGLHGLAQGLDTVIEAAAHLANQPQFLFLLIGDGPVKASLMRDVEARGLPNVRFLAMMPPRAVAPYLLDADALLVPLRSHPIFDIFVPSKLYDYLACARPVILSVNGEAREILEASGGGTYCLPGDPQALADAVKGLAVLPAASRHEMGRRGRAYVLEHYTRRAQGAALLRLLEPLSAAVSSSSRA